MSTIAAPSPLATPERRRAPYFAAKLLGSSAILALAVAFVLRYVFRYYLHFNQASFTDPLRGAANYWAMRGWLLMHITGGMVALLTGPWQFWTGFRSRFVRIHRWTGRLFLSGVAIGCIGAFRMAVSTTFGWGFGAALLGLALAWATTACMAFYAILNGRIQIHKEWMVRAYVVTFAFVTFRLLNDFGQRRASSPPAIVPLPLAGLAGLILCSSPKSSCNSGACAHLPVPLSGSIYRTFILERS